eukprot:2824555-Pyramimonas_sp.AAC.1
MHFYPTGYIIYARNDFWETAPPALLGRGRMPPSIKNRVTFIEDDRRGRHAALRRSSRRAGAR